MTDPFSAAGRFEERRRDAEQLRALERMTKRNALDVQEDSSYSSVTTNRGGRHMKDHTTDERAEQALDMLSKLINAATRAKGSDSCEQAYAHIRVAALEQAQDLLVELRPGLTRRSF